MVFSGEHFVVVVGEIDYNIVLIVTSLLMIAYDNDNDDNKHQLYVNQNNLRCT